MRPNSIENAIVVATQAHAGQTDRGGDPYILHPLRVMLACHRHGSEVAAAAVLHDVIEDTPYNHRVLLHLGIPSSVVTMVEHLSRQPGEHYTDYIERVLRLHDPFLLAIKEADIEDNLKPERVTQARLFTTDEKLETLVKRYRWALSRIDEALTS